MYKLINKILEKNIISKSRTFKNNVNIYLTLSIQPLAMSRALLNIILNAISYSNKLIKISSKETSNYIDICIEDDGSGIPKNKREDVFKAFYRIDESRLSKAANTGLGLTIAKNIIQSHGGKISLNQSSLGGLEVNIAIPLE